MISHARYCRYCKIKADLDLLKRMQEVGQDRQPDLDKLDEEIDRLRTELEPLEKCYHTLGQEVAELLSSLTLPQSVL